jgi:hypothetical protein
MKNASGDCVTSATVPWTISFTPGAGQPSWAQFAPIAERNGLGIGKN